MKIFDRLVTFTLILMLFISLIVAHEINQLQIDTKALHEHISDLQAEQDELSAKVDKYLARIETAVQGKIEGL